MSVTAGLVAFACFAPAAHADGVTLEMGTLAADGSRYMKDILAMSREIENRTDGLVRLKWYSDGKRGDEVEMAAKVRAGTLHGGAFSDVGLAELVPEMRAFGHRGLFRDHEEVDQVSDAVSAEVGELFADRQLVFTMWADLGFSRVFSTSKLTSVEDVSKRLPSMNDPQLKATISDGTSKIWAMPPLYAIAYGVHTDASHVWGLPYRYVIGGLVFAEFAWNALSGEQQDVVVEVCAEWQPKARKRWRAETVKGLNAMKKQGITLYRPSNGQTASFFATSDAARDSFGEQWKIERMMTRLSDALDALRND